MELQWGHDFSAVEIAKRETNNNFIVASMGPRLFSRGNECEKEA